VRSIGGNLDRHGLAGQDRAGASHSRLLRSSDLNRIMSRTSNGRVTEGAASLTARLSSGYATIFTRLSRPLAIAVKEKPIALSYLRTPHQTARDSFVINRV
jgi:hypothetical protein